MIPGSPEWEHEVCHRDFNMAGQLVNELRKRLDNAYAELVSASQRLGRAEEALERTRT